MNYDAIVVGGGMAGLTSAASLAKAGRSVLLFEKEKACGGLVNSFERDGFIFDGGIRATENSGVLFPMVKKLGLDIQYVRNKISLGIEDRVIHITTEEDVQAYQSLLEYLYPESKDEIIAITLQIKNIMQYMKVQYGIDNPVFLDVKEDRDYFIKAILPWMVKYILTVPKINRMQAPVVEFLQRYTQNQKLLDIIVEAPSDARLKAYVSLVRGGMDYQFFQMLTERIDKASGEEKSKLEALREKLLGFTSEVDKQLEARYKQAQELVEKILSQDDVVKAVQDNLGNITQDVVDIASQMLKQASDKNDYARMGKLQKMIDVLRQASTPPEVEFIEQLLDAPDDASLEKMLEASKDMINDQFMEALIGLVAQVDQAAEQGNPEAKGLSEKLSKVYKTAMKFSMKKNLG